MAKYYKVFVSHAGEDKDSIAAPLYHELKSRGINAFLDREELRVGGNALEEMKHAMEIALIGVFLLSPEFAAKKWTMEELYCFLRRIEDACEKGSGPILIPVFYRLTVAECRYVDLLERYGQVFVQNKFIERVENNETSTKKVRRALAKLAATTGIEYKGGAASASGDDGRQRLIHLICDEISRVLAEVQERSSNRGVGGGLVGSSATVFVPRNPEEVLLDFDTAEDDGGPRTQEGVVLERVLRRSKLGGRAGIVSIEGMAGVGKSCVLRGLAEDSRLRDHFHDGIFLVSLGMDATVEELVFELLAILRVSGGKGIAEELRSESSLRVVLHGMKNWLESKRCLLLVDDLWDRNGLNSTTLTDLSAVFSDDSGSIVVCSTRFAHIAIVGESVKLQTKDPLSGKCEEILLRYAKFDMAETREETIRMHIKELLLFCAGLLVCLTSVGRGVALIARKLGSRRLEAWAKYLSKLRATCLRPTCVSVTEYGDIKKTLQASLSTVKEYGVTQVTFLLTYSFEEMHRALCVLRKQTKASVSVLRRLWGLNKDDEAFVILELFADAGLAEMVSHEIEGMPQLQLHDLVHDFALLCAQSHGEVVLWHKRMLHNYMEGEAGGDKPGVGSRVSTFLTGLHKQSFNFDTRKWWHIEDDCYIYANVCRHLVESDGLLELVALLLSAEWTLLRYEIGGILSWNQDTSLCLNAIQTTNNFSPDAKVDLNHGLSLVRDAVRESWSFVSKNRTEFGFQLHARLQDIEDLGGVVQRYLDSVCQIQRAPWLKPIMRCYSCPGRGSLRLEVQLHDPVRSIALIDGSNSAVIALRRNLALIDVESGTVYRQMSGHTRTVTYVTLSPDRIHVLSGSLDGTVRVWQLPEGTEAAKPFRGHTGAVRCVAVEPSGKLFVSGSDDGTIRVSAFLGRGTLREPIQCHGSGVRFLAVSPNGELIISGSSDGTVRRWELWSGKEIGEPLRGHKDQVWCLAVASDGRHLVSGSNDGTVCVWDILEGTAVGAPISAHGSRVRCVALSRDAKHIFSGSWDRTIRMWDMQTREIVGEPFHGHGRPVVGIDVSSDGERLVSGSWDGTVRVWEIGGRENLEAPCRQHKSAVLCVTGSSDGQYAVSGCQDGMLQLWELNRGNAMGDALRAHGGAVYCIAISRNEYVASGSKDGTVRMWGLPSLRPVGEPLRGHDGSVWCVTVSTDGKFMVSGSTDGTVRVWEAVGGTAVHVLQGHAGRIGQVVISVDSRFIVAGCSSGTVQAWKVDTGERVGVLRREHEAAIWRLDISSSMVVRASDWFGKVRKWRLDGDDGLVKDFHDDNNAEHEEAWYGEQDVVCDGRLVGLGSASRSVLATLPFETDVAAWCFIPRKEILVTGLFDGQVVVHRLVK